MGREQEKGESPLGVCRESKTQIQKQMERMIGKVSNPNPTQSSGCWEGMWGGLHICIYVGNANR